MLSKVTAIYFNRTTRATKRTTGYFTHSVSLREKLRLAKIGTPKGFVFEGLEEHLY